jgi:hypothetical protein
MGNSKSGSFRIYPAERHLGSPAVAPELRSGGGTAGTCRGGKLHRVGTCTKGDRWRASIDYPNPAYFCMMVRGGIPADLLFGVGKVYNLCKCKTIRIVTSSVMDSCGDHYIAQSQVLVL